MPNFKERIYEIITNEQLSGLTKEALLKRLGAKSAFENKQIGQALNELAKEGKLVVQENKKTVKYFLPHRINAYKGKIQGNARGFGFFISPELGEDVFIPPRAMNNAVHGDTVMVKVNKHKTQGQSLEGEVLSILERGAKTVVGQLSVRQNQTFGFVTPDDNNFNYDIFIPADSFNGAKNGQKVVAEITAYPDEKSKSPQGRIIEILGDVSQKGVDILSIIRSYNLYEEFDQKVLENARKVAVPISQNDLKGRQDYRDWKIITIDGDDAKDLDDAVSLYKDEKGHYYLGVHIADVSHYVKPNSPLDKEALKRGTSVYFADRVLPMLPKELSNGICSLNELEDRLTLSVLIEFDTEGEVVGSEIYESVINSKARMTYDKVNRLLAGDRNLEQKYLDFLPMLKEMEELMYLLNAKRRERGSIDFEIPESKIILDKNGKVIDVMPYPRGVSNRIIEEFMIAANEAVAETFFHADIPFVYRIHENPSEEKTAAMISFVESAGLKVKMNKNNAIFPKTVQQILEQAEGKPIYNIINKVVLRCMQKARYYEENLGHFGLASKFYCHFTSPIRRYPDLAIHRIIKDFLHNGLQNMKKYEKFVVEASAISSDRERIAENAERDVDDLLKTQFMSEKIGEKYEGIISGVTEFGVFVELPNTCEGLVKIDNLPKDYYHFDEANYALVGKRMVYRLGDKMEVIVAGADLENRRVEFLPA
ncbi:MAG TPA: ribonuclease R [Clostridia bacterium]|jgi:ribonuclease R